MSSPIGQMITPHVSAKKLAHMVEEMLGFERFGLVKDNVGIVEQAETQRLANQLQDNLQTEQQTPAPSEGVTDGEVAGINAGGIGAL